jgi:signal transduction histidine kinase
VQEELRVIARGIHPAILAHGGLRPVLRAVARRSPIPVKLNMPVELQLAERFEVAAYYVVSETLTNAAKHAHASAIHVDVEVVEGSLRVSIRDDGVGGADPSAGSGLVGLKDRVESLGGSITIQSPPGVGTSVLVELPLGD